LKEIYKWKFSLKEKSFSCDLLLPDFLGFSNLKNISLQQFFSCFDDDQVTEIKDAFREVVTTQRVFEKRVLINTNEQRYFIQLSISPIHDDITAVEGSIADAQQFPTSIQEKDFLREIFLNANTARMIATHDHIIVMANKRFCEDMGYQEHELIGQHARLLKSGQYEPEFYRKLWDAVNTLKVWRGELLSKNKQQQIYTREVKIERFDFANGEYFYLLSSAKLDIPLTLFDSQYIPENDHSHLPSKEKYLHDLQSSFKKLDKDQTIVLTTFNIDWLQKISEFTACWLVSQRFNLVKQMGTLGVLSKGLYSIYWIEGKNPDRIDQLLRRLLKAFSHGFDDSGFDLFSTVNMGASILSVDAKNPAQLISHSTQTLIANPAKEFSSLYYYDPRLVKRYDRHQMLAKLLKNALNSKNIDVYYQPIIELSSMEAVEFEALFRIHLDTDIDYDTQELIIIAETYNWIDEIDAMVAQIALAALPKIQQYYNKAGISMAINRSLVGDKLTHRSLEDTIELLLASKVDLSHITIELTESVIFENFEQQKQWVNELQKHGIKVAIDDFGTGYSSFAYLNNLPINFIKIDRYFVNGLTQDSNEYAIIEMLCKLAHNIGAQVIAEGVETIEELTLLARAKVDRLQGYIFSQPLSLDALLSAPHEPYSEALMNAVSDKHNATVAAICIDDIQSIAFDDRLSVITDALSENSLQQYFVILDGKKCSGVLYINDYYAAISPYIGSSGEQKRDLMTLDKRAHQIMQKDFFTLHRDSDIELAEQFFAQQPGSAIVILDSHGDYCGITTVKAYLMHQQSEKEEAIIDSL